jgi:hypothetical protein
MSGMAAMSRVENSSLSRSAWFCCQIFFDFSQLLNRGGPGEK